jgi:hypothetical protein
MSLAGNITAIKTMVGLARFTNKRGLKAAAYKAAGLYLERLRIGRTKAEWVDLVQVNCGLSVSRAYELIAVAKGTKSLKDTQVATAARRRKHYARQSKASAEKQAAERLNKVPKSRTESSVTDKAS